MAGNRGVLEGESETSMDQAGRKMIETACPNPGRSRAALWMLCLMAVALALGACREGESPAAADTASAVDVEREAIAVAALPLGRGRIESVVRFSTHLEAEEEVEVYAEAARQVVELLVEEGDSVAAGDLLLRLEDDEQKSELAKVESQLARSRRELDRQKRLFEQELISEQAFSDATYETEQLEIAYEEAARRLGYTRVEAPIAGVITSRLIGEGDHVKVNDHLFDIVDFDSIVARIYVPERELTRLEVGQEARLAPLSYEDRPFRGEVERIAPVVDVKSGTIKVTLAIPRQQGLRPGMYVDVELVAEVDADALLVPKRALVYDQEQIYVYRVEGDQVERVWIRPTLEDRQFVRIDGGVEGLSEGDSIVVAGQAGLKDGARIRLLDLANLESLVEGAESGS